MSQNEIIISLIKDLPDSEGALRFFNELEERHGAQAKKLLKNQSLLSDVLTLAAFSPLLAATLLQNPDYISWLVRERTEIKIRAKEELLESLARFSLTHSQIEPQILLARFRRRELLRIYLRDIRRLGTISQITQEISNLADAILEYALRIARQELDNRYGIPLEIDENGRSKQSRFCIVSLGKLGSNELNYSSDIDLLFLYSCDGSTSGQGSCGIAANREYFVKLAEFVTKIVGEQTGEGAAYRVDLRLRPHGRVGAIAISYKGAVNYYQESASGWERQMLIRARSSAGDEKIFREFFTTIESSVYSTSETVENALKNVKLSKDKINLEHFSDKGFNVKLGRGGIREIEFIAQALQLAYGGRDAWLRASHTLISLSRLADRGLLSETELTELFDAYDFLRRVEHRLQMEHGLQTHVIPKETEKQNLVAKRMSFNAAAEFETVLQFHTSNVKRIFERVFRTVENTDKFIEEKKNPASITERDKTYQTDIQNGNGQALSRQSALTAFGNKQSNQLLKNISASLEKSETKILLSDEKLSALQYFCEVSPYFSEAFLANPKLIKALPLEKDEFQTKNYLEILETAVLKQTNFRNELAALRTHWTKCFLEIAAFDVFGRIDLNQSKQQQTELAEASLQAALLITEREIYRRSNQNKQPPITNFQLPLAVLGLGKLGSRGMDYGSDLDLILTYDDEKSLPVNLTDAEFFGRATEIFVSALSSFTREGHLYRVDLRLRPDGKNGATSIGKTAFLNYLETRSAIWEWLAYVKIRGVLGDGDSALEVEKRARKIIHENVLKIERNELKNETRRVRERLEQEKTRGAKDVNIKFGAGGLLDIYFAMRFLQLRDNVADDLENRSTLAMLKKLFENESLTEENFSTFSEGYKFLSSLDHNLRLTVGRSNRLPLANKTALQTIAKRMKLESTDDMFEKLALHRIEIRGAFENILD